MKKSLFFLTSVSLQALAGQETFEAYISKKIKSNPESQSRIREVSTLAMDYVIHYEKAIVLGTSNREYRDHTLISHFESMYSAVNVQCSGDIDLGSCLKDLLCQGKIDTNLNVSWMLCDHD